MKDLKHKKCIDCTVDGNCGDDSDCGSVQMNRRPTIVKIRPITRSVFSVQPIARFKARKRNPICVDSKSIKIFKLIFALICFIILLYQSIQLITTYLNFETTIMIVTNLKKHIVEYPAISICERFPRLEVVFVDGQTHIVRIPIPQMKLFMDKGWAKREEGSMKVKLANVWDQVLQMEKEEGLGKIKDFFGPVDGESIECVDPGVNKTRCDPSFHSLGAVSQCRTYFGQIDPNGRVVNRWTRKIEKSIEEDHNVIAMFAINFTDLDKSKNFLIDKEVFVAVHESKEFAADKITTFASHRLLLKNNQSHELSFVTKRFVRLPKPYETDCHNYEIEVNSKDIYGLSRELCLLKCRTDMIYDRFHCLQEQFNVIYGQPFTELDNCNSSISMNVTPGGIYEIDWQNVLKCHRICKPDCVQELYTFELNKVTESFDNMIFGHKKNDPDFGYLTVFANNMAQLSYHYLPKMNLTDFLCNIGGLFSLWLGLSVLSIYDYMAAIGSALNRRLKLYIK